MGCLGVCLGAVMQSVMFVAEACIFATLLCGFLGLLLRRNLILKILAMDVMSTGVIAFYVLIATHSGTFAPIIESGFENADLTDGAIAYADPVPQAVILTAIVIGFSIQALMLAGVIKLSSHQVPLDCDRIEDHFS